MTNFILPDREQPTFQEELIKMSNEKLCEIVVVYRYLGMMKDQSILAMEELGNRRKTGDTYEYEKEIDTKLQSLPKLKLDMKTIMSAGPNMLSGIGSILGGIKK
jgi:hypothetical protein